MRSAAAYRADIDGLRALAVLAVFVFHLNHSWLPGGFFGVDIFFVISGYLITGIILREQEGGAFQFARFYQRRIARLLPPFFTMAAAVLAGAALIYSPQDLASAGATAAAAAGSLANIKFLLQGNYFKLSPDAQPFLHCWSLSVEEQFYLLFPALLLFCRRKWVLPGLTAFSFASYLVVDRLHPEWAFYLLPTRAWELLAGSLLSLNPPLPQYGGPLGPRRTPWSGLAILLIAISFSFARFTLLPVLATILLLSTPARALSWKPLVLIGRMSYSLYLWHWPVFSLIDYLLYWHSATLRMALKVSISLAAAAACYFLIERPARLFLNRPANRTVAFASLAASFALFLPLGIAIRDANYVNAAGRTVRRGGLHFNPGGRGGSMILMGDSNGSMYGKLAAEIAREHDLRLTVISVDAGDPLPKSSGVNPALWSDSLAVVRRENPDFLILACNWNKLAGDPARLRHALAALEPYARHILLFTQPPVLPENATREAIRAGHRPPFYEDAGERAVRTQHNDIVRSSRDANVNVLDLDPLFSRQSGELRFVDDRYRQLYQDRDHLSAAGAELVKPELLQAITSPTASR